VPSKEQDKTILSWEDLGIPTDELTSIKRFAVNAVRMYRRVHRYDANIQDAWVHPAGYREGNSHHHVPVDMKRVQKK